MNKKRKRSDGFTEAQRQWILERDDHICQLCMQGDEQLQVHHVVPFRYAATVLHWTLERVNNPTNGITLCKICHISGQNSIHPDIARANAYYREDKKIYNKVFAQRDNLCRQGVPYWMTAHDNTMSVRAIENTCRHIAKGNFPIPWYKEDESNG